MHFSRARHLLFYADLLISHHPVKSNAALEIIRIKLSHYSVERRRYTLVFSSAFANATASATRQPAITANQTQPLYFSSGYFTKLKYQLSRHFIVLYVFKENMSLKLIKQTLNFHKKILIFVDCAPRKKLLKITIFF